MIIDNECSGLIPQNVYNIIRLLLKISFICIPIILIITLIIAYAKASINGEEDLKKLTPIAIKKVISALIAFLLPFLFQVFLGSERVQNYFKNVNLLEEYKCFESSGYIVKSNEEQLKDKVIITLYPNFEYSSVVLPNGGVLSNKQNIVYSTSKNGIYDFKFKDDNGEVIYVAKYELSNGDSTPPIGNCIVKDGVITVSADDSSGIAGYSYFVNGKYTEYSNKSSYKVSNESSSYKVKVKDNADNESVINCKINRAKEESSNNDDGYVGASSNGPKQVYNGSNSFTGSGSGCLSSVSIPSSYGYRRNGHQNQCLPLGSISGTMGSNCTVTVSYNGGVTASATANGICFTPKEFGSATVTYSFSSGCMCDGQARSGSTSFLISEWGLHSLSVSGGCSINFYNMTTSYSCTVPYSTSSVNVSATPNNAGSKMSGTGTHNLSVGSNNISVTVTTPEGRSTTYTVVVTRSSS